MENINNASKDCAKNVVKSKIRIKWQIKPVSFVTRRDKSGMFRNFNRLHKLLIDYSKKQYLQTTLSDELDIFIFVMFNIYIFNLLNLIRTKMIMFAFSLAEGAQTLNRELKNISILKKTRSYDTCAYYKLTSL